MAGKALLIGVPHYESDAIPDLDFVRNDLHSLDETLRERGFDTEQLGIDEPATRNAIVGTIYDFARRADQTNLNVIYFSGHGMHHAGRDYLVPSDARLLDEIIGEVMVPVDISRAIDTSRARGMIFFVDACREGVDLGEKGALSLQSWTTGKLDVATQRTVAYVFACGPGQVSRFVREPEGFSLFGKALQETLQDARIRLTFGQLRSELQRRLDRLADRHDKKRQSIRILSEAGADDSKLAELEIWRAAAGAAGNGVAGYSAIDFTPILDSRISAEDITILSQTLSANPPWIEGPVSAMHVLRAAGHLGETVGEVLRRLRRFEAVGITLPEIELEEVAELKVSKQDLVALAPTLGFTTTSREEDRVSAPHVLYASYELSEPVVETCRRLARFKPAGIAMPNMDLDGLGDLRAAERDLVALSQQLDGRPPWVEENVPPYQLARAANRLRESVGAVIERLSRLEPTGIATPPVPVDAVADLMVTNEDLRFLSRDLDSAAPWIEAASGTHLVRAAHATGRTVGEVLEALRRFEPLGVVLPDVDPHQVASFVVADEDLVALSQDLDGLAPWIEGSIPPGHLLRAANTFGEPVGSVVHRLRRFEALRIGLPHMDPEGVARLTVSDEDLVLLRLTERRWLTNYGDPHVLSLGDLLEAASELEQPLGAVLRRAARFKPARVEVPAIDPSQIDDLTVDQQDLMLLSRDLDGRAPWLEGRVAPAHLVNAAVTLGVPVSELATRLERLAPLGVTSPEADLGALAGEVFTQEDLVVLSVNTDGRQPWLDGAISAMHVLRAAHTLGVTVGDVRARLKRFEPIGIHLPAMDEAAVADLTVAPEDAWALSAAWDPAWGEVGPSEGYNQVIRLLVASKELDAPIQAIIERLARFVPTGIRLPRIDVGRLGDLRVTEEDLVLLSNDMDGREPWLQGGVPVVHVLRVANRLDVPVRSVLERLERFAPLGLGLSGTFAAPAWTPPQPYT